MCTLNGVAQCAQARDVARCAQARDMARCAHARGVSQCAHAMVWHNVKKHNRERLRSGSAEI